MRAGEFPDGARTLRAKIDMASPNLNMRDPVMYRILHAEHHRTGDKWCIYPMYDFAHGQSDSIEKASRTPSARWSSKTTARSTTGSFEQLGIFPPAADRVCPAEPHLHGAEQAQAAATGQEKARQRLGRSAHADALRAAAARLHARGHPQLLRRHRRVQNQRHHRTGDAGALPARGPEPRAPRA